MRVLVLLLTELGAGLISVMIAVGWTSFRGWFLTTLAAPELLFAETALEGSWSALAGRIETALFPHFGSTFVETDCGADFCSLAETGGEIFCSGEDFRFCFSA
jgi:hypothetical protein